ncbi:type II toxin-antitoxin system Phd/YefM family antitoxin [Microcystis aeruginosa]|uniref:type II toxin-antitoxin system Phd/YefM family antitoxin n=1 Tax=Microcystis aeruginosa TaxID=1126 RepID=UPI001BF0B27F|nr:prevent-host-death family protein [Microcystis aeruginosa]BCU11329.1 hypothetical protein MAN88_18930 [Microcystis aeruginosa]BCU13728.1 hypothetical protein MAN88_42920 [Microcystis aeruginosa]
MRNPARERSRNLNREVWESPSVYGGEDVNKRRNQKNVALIAEDELSSLLECVYLLRSPENAQRLFRSLAWAQTEDATPQTLAELKEELGIES